MKCLKCGHELSENASFCDKCGEAVSGVDRDSCEMSEIKNEKDSISSEKRKWSDKDTILVLIVVFVIAAGAGMAFNNFKAKSDSSSEIVYSGNNLEDEADVNEELGVNEKPDVNEESEVNVDLPSNEENLEGEQKLNLAEENVEEGVLRIRERYNDISANIAEGRYEEYSLQDGIIVYCDDSELCAIVISKDVNQNPYRRFYYYDDGELIFSYYENEDAHRLYFQDEQLIRWRYSKDAANAQDAINYDFGESEEYMEWESCALDESNKYKEQFLSISANPFSMSKIERIYASSELSEYNMVHSVERLVDGDTSTAWVEGAAGQGIGEAVTFDFDGEYLIQGIKIGAGYQKSVELYNKNSRPSQIGISFSDGTYEVYDLEDINDYQDVILNKTRYTEYITLTINGVYPGNKYEDTAISEIYFY